MRKQTSAGIIAGAVSDLPPGIIFAAMIVWGANRDLWTMLTASSTPQAGLAVTVFDLMLAIMLLGSSVFVGAIGGFVFTLLLNRLPSRSTYVNAVLLVFLVWFIPIILLAAVTGSFIAYVEYVETSFLWGVLGIMVLDALIFAYLFNRWTIT